MIAAGKVTHIAADVTTAPGTGVGAGVLFSVIDLTTSGILGSCQILGTNTHCIEGALAGGFAAGDYLGVVIVLINGPAAPGAVQASFTTGP
jgi:hypothetical protein